MPCFKVEHMFGKSFRSIDSNRSSLFTHTLMNSEIIRKRPTLFDLLDASTSQESSSESNISYSINTTIPPTHTTDEKVSKKIRVIYSKEISNKIAKRSSTKMSREKGSESKNDHD